MATELGFEHFYEFYGKFNVLSDIPELISKSPSDITVFNSIFGDGNKESPQPELGGYTQTLKNVLDKQHNSNKLIESFENKQDKPKIPEPDNIAKILRIGDLQDSRPDLTISGDVVAKPNPDWFEHTLVSIFKIDENAEYSNIIDLHLKDLNYSFLIKNLFTFHEYRVGREIIKNAQYVWKSKYNMLRLLNQPFLLLTFDMYYYNNNNTPLFRSNFDIMSQTSNEQMEAASEAQEKLRSLLLTKKTINIEPEKTLSRLREDYKKIRLELRAAADVDDTVAIDPLKVKLRLIRMEIDRVQNEVDVNTRDTDAKIASELKALESTSVEEQKKEPILLGDLLSIETFSPTKLPTFLMLLIYYAGYSFNIYTPDITSKFRNKFNQSSNKTSFPIKLYVPIAHPNETKYNNKVTGTIKPETVDLSIETLQVYHVGIKIASLWDYVNGKLTILISNMLNSSDKTVKDSFKILFKKTYNSNKLFLFECISELKKYKEYILNSSNIQSIEFPMSTLKTLEILILKLSYILSVLEPTFIPIETMSFDVTMNGKILKYVINSELQATNISIDDHISNDKLMAAILSTRAVVIDGSEKGIAQANNFFSESTALEVQKSLIQKEVDTCTNNTLAKLIAYKKIERERNRSYANYEKIRSNTLKKETEEGLNTAIQHYKLELDYYKARQEYNLAYQVLNAANELSDYFKKNELPPDELFINFRKPTDEITNENIEKTMKKLQDKTNKLKELKAKSPEDRAKINRAPSIEEASDVEEALAAEKLSRAKAANSSIVQTRVEIKRAHTHKENQCGFRFGRFNTVASSDYVLGKIVGIDKDRNNIGKLDPKELDIFDGIGKDFILLKIERHPPFSSGNPTTIWENHPTLKLGQNGDPNGGNLRADFKRDPNYISTMDEFHKSWKRKEITDEKYEEYEEAIFRLQYLLHILNNLDSNITHTFTFEKPRLSRTTPDGDLLFSGGSKNTTKKVNRRQAQTQGKIHSKTKKVFESEVIN
jgi:cellobiose-specific phosphotransferase system component IIA